MIHVLHGENTDDSERYLKSLLVNYKDIPKVQLTDKDRIELFQEAVYAEDLFETEKLVICRNWLSSKKIKLNSLSEIPQNRTVIFLEDTKLALGQAAKNPSNLLIKEFKLQSTIFWFLDSLSPDFSKSARYLPQIETDKKNILVWNLLFRVSLLIAVKYQARKEKSQDFFERNIQDWQWDKIQRQADLFSLNTLIGFYRGLLRLDYATKNGTSAMDEKSLVAILLLKYLPA
ncbi:hypothetical protein A3D07_00285 [Candidatus Curtissbacteria bacterium RIFCSPHIGHO2_02_FULL_42_15]|uniref:DNA polymerase III delta N-terminal domain-containing protein n=1 Tax=Candidatus Curtissbacteria bacterium RIFCSPHIGHO2_02_FULL_42_15 TaxID=1797716 RepID=A0A1F5GIY4_9BACT|nr:MAG: hypothetical protein A3D07_00285 [Candidatus Curtissbacteria bacterium RIFCSPHIGHO2_02_FULL_42_15]